MVLIHPGINILSAVKPDSYTHKHALTCKFCGTPTSLRSHRKNIFEFLRTRCTGKVPFRCSRCLRRFWQIIDPRDL